MELSDKQKEVKELIEKISVIIGIDPFWASSVAMTESSLGANQKSPTGARGVFQMTSISLEDLFVEMGNTDEDIADILCGLAFLWLLKKRWRTNERATLHFCSPDDRSFYLDRVLRYIDQFKENL